MVEAGVEFPDFGEIRDEIRRRSQLRKEAFQATQVRATGKSRAEIREIYMAELRTRDLEIPAEPVLGAIVERINGNPLPAARVLGGNLVEMARGFHRLFKVFGLMTLLQDLRGDIRSTVTIRGRVVECGSIRCGDRHALPARAVICTAVQLPAGLGT